MLIVIMVKINFYATGVAQNLQNEKNTRTGFRNPEFQTTHFHHDLSEYPQT